MVRLVLEMWTNPETEIKSSSIGTAGEEAELLASC